ncbi:MAG: methyltransferase domain-containing protein [Clostridia bacterium]|nr:methyltransferase domain-containing protein [Clostridia bacterium]
MTNNELSWDKLLQIKTVGRDDTNSDEYRYPYEPTPYSVLERLVSTEPFGKDDVVLDYGCGKGRVGFFISYRTKAQTVGIEYDARIFQSALNNRKSAVSRTKADFVLTRAEEYEVPTEVNRCYFFNPFSVEILQKVMARIIDSWYAAPREILLFFYYPSDEFMCYLMALNELEFYDEIECGDLFEGNDPRERIMVFELPFYEIED